MDGSVIDTPIKPEDLTPEIEIVQRLAAKKRREKFSVEEQLKGVRALREIFGHLAEEDPDAWSDMVEGETDLFEALGFYLRKMNEHTAMASGCKELAAQYSAKQKSNEKQRDRIRTSIEVALMQAGLVDGRFKLPEGTISARLIDGEVEISDESQVPSDYWVRADPKIDKKALNAAVRALPDGESIPGVTAHPKRVSLQIRK